MKASYFQIEPNQEKKKDLTFNIAVTFVITSGIC